jgi:serralysin
VDAAQQSEGWTIFLPDYRATPLVDTLAGVSMPSDQYGASLVESEPTELIWLMGDLENATGSGFDDWINGNRFDNHLRGGAGDDALEGYAGDDTLDGNGGQDIAYFAGTQSSFTLTLGPEATRLQDRRAEGSGTDTLRSIETVEFYSEADRQSLDLETFGGTAGLSVAAMESFVELYIAYFNRAPDALGLNFWGTAFANGTSLETIAADFNDQSETRALYPEGLSNADFISSVYDNVLGRAPDADGFAFWVDVLDSGQVDRGTFILAVLGGARAESPPDATEAFISQQMADRAYLEAKTDLGALFAVHHGMSDVTEANQAMALFDGSQSGLDAAVARIDAYHEDALDPETGDFLMPLVGVLDNPFETIT